MFGLRRALGPVLPLLLLSLPLSLGGCQKSSPPPPPSRGLPPLASAPTQPGDPLGHPEHEPVNPTTNLPPGHPALPAGHPAVAGQGAAGMGSPFAGQATPGGIAFDPKSVLAGQIRVDKKVKSKVAAGDTIFLVARGAGEGGTPGPVLAVKKLTAGAWPLVFEIDGRDAMLAGTKLAGKVVVTARVDKDGDAMTKNPGDVLGKVEVSPPSSKVVLTLDRVL
jgi:hypothetical protein